MNKRIAGLIAGAGTMIAAAAASAADWPAGTYPGPYAPDALALTYIGIDLNAQAAPAGTYSRYTVTADWGGGGGGADPQWRSDQRVSFGSADPTGLTTANGTVYLGGAAPNVGGNTAAAGPIGWNTMTLASEFTADGVNTLWLGIRSSYDGDAGNTTWSNVSVTLQTLTCNDTETEPNDPFGSANIFDITQGRTMCGVTTGLTMDGSITSYDYFLAKRIAPGGIYKHRVQFIGATTTQFATTRCFGQDDGVPDYSADFLMNYSDDVSDYMEFYTFGNSTEANARAMLLRVGGSAATTAKYQLLSSVAQQITPPEISRTLRAGNITITTDGQTIGGQTDTKIAVLDGDCNIVPGWSNDDEPTGNSYGSTLTRTFAPGTYYVMISTYALATSDPAAVDDAYRNGIMLQNPGVAACDDYLSNGEDVSFKITDADGEVFTPAATNGPLEIVFFKLVVTGGEVNQRCQPADIACDDGTALPADTNIHPNGGVNEGDYNSFFQGFFDAAANCDIANDDATPLPPFGTLTSNGGVNEGDYNCFFQKFFDGCPV